MGDAEHVRLSLYQLPAGGPAGWPLCNARPQQGPPLTGPEKSLPEAQGDQCAPPPEHLWSQVGLLRSWVSSLRLAALNFHCCYFLESESEVTATLCDSMDCSPPGSSGHGILQARILE